jgi:hypothetical protein
MRESFLAVDAATDVRALTSNLRRRGEVVSAGGQTRGQVRQVVARFWSRLRRAGLDPTRLHPRPALDINEFDAPRLFSPLRHAPPALRPPLDAIAKDGQHVVVICDAPGRVL